MKLLKKLTEKTKSLCRKMKSAFDKCGSYTGDPSAPEQKAPEQDADDL